MTKAIAAQTVRNMSRHFIVWGTLAVIVMFAGIHENQNGTMHFDRPAAAGTYEDVLSKNVCKDTVEGEFPTGAIVYNVRTGGYEFTKNPAKIGKALDEALGGKDWHGFTPRHFCR